MVKNIRSNFISNNLKSDKEVILFGQELHICINNKDLREKVIVLGILTGILLPVRVLFYTYISQYWIGSLGLMSMVAIIMFVLVKKKKLGWFGPMFENQMAHVTRGRMGKIALAITFLSIMFFSISLLLIEQGNTAYLTEKLRFESLFKGSIPSYVLTGNEKRIDFVPSVSTAIVNDLTRGWMEHINILILVGEFEALAVLLFYRKAFKRSV